MAMYIKKYPKLLFIITFTALTAVIITHKKKTVLSWTKPVTFFVADGIWNCKDSETGNDLFNPDYDKSSKSITSSRC